ncbi:glycoside hydrolase family 27 protein [Arthrobacter psychrochitiniphilus]|uniref:Alpha-galactosidase n=1 Tax=Arthrobacter psychrochitiniphilus TaxID=291045 RepID=A0A2V3DMM2_9MICC|nr:glycoside hydrolase family 27 protein [Arthrobacter psychrochitiniphilus]NYG18089.1 alpha-galactosidase [Arthrobacter psychrochitiniphilus]PXA64195.1 hypothetical protein CVS29_16345 [Arthrobacter psychrochitiniphilus]
MTDLQYSGKPLIAPVPPMGWNSWNCFRCHDISEQKLIEVADALVASGMQAAGFDTFVIDDCWQAHTRGADGRLRSHPTRFPSGMAALGQELKARGFKFGLYASPGRKTCAMIYDRYPGRDLGSFNREELDAQTFAGWGVDFLKYDWCEADEDGTGLRYPDAFERMALALEGTGRKIIYSISEYGRTEPWTWAGDYGHMWRTTVDIERNWASIMSIADTQALITEFAGPHHWNDPDMLQAGNPGLNKVEEETHFALWCYLAAPLMAGHDPRTMSDGVRELLTNPHLLGIDQDPLGKAASRTQPVQDVDVWARPLSDGEAWLVVNKTENTIHLTHQDGELRLGQVTISPIAAGAQVLPLRSGSPAPLTEGTLWEIPPHGCLAVSHRD